MITQSRDRALLDQATECLREMVTPEVLDVWCDDPKNVMLVENDNVGMATYEYPGLYSLHWYYQSARGREAINLGKRMVAYLFEHCGAQALRGLISVADYFKASRWACRQVGMKSCGFFTYPDGDVNELFCLTKKEFLEGTNE